MYNKKKYIEFINNNEVLTHCQKVDFGSIKRDIFYVKPESDNQINVYVEYCHKKKDFFSLMRLKILFSYFIDFDLIEKLIHNIETTKMLDSQIYNYISQNSHGYYDIYYNIYANVFEDISIKFYSKYLNSNADLAYLDYKNNDHPEYADQFAKCMNILIGKNGPYDIISIFNMETRNINETLNEIKQFIKKGGYIIIFAINVVDDFDVMIEDICHEITNYSGERKTYYNYMEYDFIMHEHDFEWSFGFPIYSTFGLGAEYNNPMFAVYKYIGI